MSCPWFVYVCVKLSLFLTKYHAINTDPLLNKVPHCEDLLGEWRIALRNLHLDTRWRVTDQLHAPTALLLGKDPPVPTHWIGSWVGFRGGLDAVARRKKSIPCHYWESNPGCPAHSLVTHYTKLPSSLCVCMCV
jgi:hypothetical protein